MSLPSPPKNKMECSHNRGLILIDAKWFNINLLRARTIACSFEDGDKIAPSHTFLPPWCWVMGRLSTFIPLLRLLTAPSMHGWQRWQIRHALERHHPQIYMEAAACFVDPLPWQHVQHCEQNFLSQSVECGKGAGHKNGDAHKKSSWDVYLVHHTSSAL